MQTSAGKFKRGIEYATHEAGRLTLPWKSGTRQGLKSSALLVEADHVFSRRVAGGFGFRGLKKRRPFFPSFSFLLAFFLKGGNSGLAFSIFSYKKKPNFMWRLSRV